MRAIIVDDEYLMIHKFTRLTAELDDLELVEGFDNSEDALEYVKQNSVEAAFLDIEMPGINGIELAKRLRECRKDILIVFITAYEDYISDANEVNSDYYILKPYTKETLENVMEKLRLLSARQKKEIYIQTFGRFVVRNKGVPVRLTGKAKEILALVVTRRGKEISNEEIYSTIWEGRPYSNASMSVYYNALRRLKNALRKAGIEGILVSTVRGQTVDTELFDCDYYLWKDKKLESGHLFEGEFMSEYSWGEYILATILREDRETVNR